MSSRTPNRLPGLLVAHLAALGLAAGCSGSTSAPSDAGATADAAGVDAAATSDAGGQDAAPPDSAPPPDGGSKDANTPPDAGPSAPITVAAFDTFNAALGGFITCDATGTCFGNRGGINKLAPGATTTTVIGNSTNGLITALPASIHLDTRGNLYTNACGGAGGVYRLAAGAAVWTNLNAGLTTDTSCNFNTVSSDATGTLYVGFAITKSLFKLPAGQTTWVDAAPGLTNAVQEVVTRGGDVYVATRGGVSVLTAGAAEWTDVGTGNPGNAFHLRFDGAGNLYSTNNAGSDDAGVYKLAAGTTTWVVTTDLDKGDVNSPNVSDVVFDAANNGYIIARSVGGGRSLMKLAAGTLAWTPVVDLPAGVTDPCRGMANDNVGHLVAQCGNAIVRSRP